VTLTVNNAAPTLSMVQVTSPIAQGGVATLTGMIADFDGGGLTLVVNWGDGSPAQTFTYGAAAVSSFHETHTYLKPGTLPISLTLTDSDNAQTTGSTQVTVNPATQTQMLTDKLFAKILDRDANGGDVALWTGALSSGLPAGQAAQAFVESPE